MNWILLFIFFYSVSSTNIPSSVIDLNDRFLEVKDDGFWFVELFAPWCAHCKRLLPIWEHVGHAVVDKEIPVRIAKMDCTRFPSVCSTLGVNAYPTILFFRNGKQISYEGERKKESIIDFAIKASSPLVEEVKNMVHLNEIREKSRSDPAFLIIGNEEDQLREEFEKASEVLFSKTRFYQIKPEIIPSQVRDVAPEARIFALKDDSPSIFTGPSESLHDWILGERWPLLPRASPSNIADLASSGKLLVLLIINHLEQRNMSSPVGIFYEKAEQAAKLVKNDNDLHSEYLFAWMDGNEIANSITLGNVDIPDLLVFNYTSYEYFLCGDSPSKMTAQSIVTWLREMKSNGAAAQGGRGVIQRVKRIAYEVYTNIHQMFATQPLLSTCLFGVPIAFLSIITYSICSADFSVERDEIYPESDFDDEEGEENELEGDEDENSPIDPDHPKAE